MAVSTTSWEYPLLARAYEALNTPWSASHAHAPSAYDRYNEAYSYCAHIVKANSRTFAMAAALLPARQRHAVHALYAFCRASDDVLDKAPHGQDASQSLIQWRARVQGYPNAYDPVLLAWADTQARYQIPHGYVTQLIDGIARDLGQRRYRNFAELTEYCYGVASTVGLMVMHIIEFSKRSCGALCHQARHRAAIDQYLAGRRRRLADRAGCIYPTKSWRSLASRKATLPSSPVAGGTSARAR